MSNFQLRNVYCNNNNNNNSKNSKKRRQADEDESESTFCYIYEKKRRGLDSTYSTSNRPQFEHISNAQIEFKPENACLKPTNSRFTLFSMCLTFIAKHIDFLDTLVDFPIQIGQLLFDECVKCSQFDLTFVKSERLIKQRIVLFAQAYPENFIEQLKCSSQQQFIYLQPLINLCFITQLDLSKCDLMSIMTENNWNLSDALKTSSDTLTHLNLSENNLNEQFVKKFTLPQRMNLVDFKKLRRLNLSLNLELKLESNYLKYFFKFPDLNEIKISIYDLCAQHYLNGFEICKCNEQSPSTQIENMGWIAKINMKQIFDELHHYADKQTSADEYKSFVKQLRNRNENSDKQVELEAGFLRRELSFYTKSKVNKSKENPIKSGTVENKEFQLITLKKYCKCFRKENEKKTTNDKMQTIPTKNLEKESTKRQESKSKSVKKQADISIDLETVCGLIEKDQLLKYYV